jgi:photosystem II stability/assembly factor-like uncharacterized protein
MKKTSIFVCSFILLIMTSASAVFSQNFWEQTNGPYGGSIKAFVINPTTQDIFAGTSNGGVFRSTNNGDSWTAVNTGLTRTNVTALAINPATRDIFAGTLGGGVFRSTNNGDSWTAVNIDLTDTFVYTLAINPATRDIFAGTHSGWVFRSTNNGDSWTAVNIGLTDTAVLALAINASGDIFAGAYFGVFRSTNNGDSWTAVNTGLTNTNVYALAINASGDIFAGTGGGVFRSTNNGESWTAVTNTGVYALAINASGDIFAGTGGVLRSTNNGDSWTAVNTGLTDTAVLALAINPATRDIFAGTLFGGVFRSTNNGDNWNAVNVGLTAIYVSALAINSSGHIFAGTSGGGVFRSTNNGDSWTAVNTGLTITDVRALAINPATRDIFAGASGGVVFRSTNNGDSWMMLNIIGSLGTPVYALAVNWSGHIFAGTFGGGVFRSTNNGDSWTAVNTGLPTHNTDVSDFGINASGHIFVGTFNVGVFRSTNNGDSWRAVNAGLTNTSVRALAINSGGHIFAGTFGGGMFRSTNNGDSWTAVNTGLTANAVFALAINASGHIFAGAQYDGVFRSTNSGDNWTAVNTGLTSTQVYVLAINSSGYIFAGTFGGGVFRSVQSTTSLLGTITGIITDANTNQPIQGASVSASGGYSDPDGTDVNGFYQIINVPEGSGYTVTASAPGYQTRQESNVTVTAGQTTTVNFALTPTRPDLTPIRRDGATHWRADLAFSPSSRGDDYVTISATIRNKGDAPATSIKVQIYDGNPSSGGALINSSGSNNPDTIAQIPANSSGAISVDWQPGTTGGKNGLFVVVDPQNVIAEADEGNNTAEYYRTPVILVPGIAGSPLYYSVDNELTSLEKSWILLPEGTILPNDPEFIDIFVALGESFLGLAEGLGFMNAGLTFLNLSTDGSSQFPIKPGPGNTGLQQETFGLPLAVGFQRLIGWMETDSYRLRDPILPASRKDNLFMFLYDWRVSNTLSAAQLGQYVSQVMEWTDSPVVNMVCHSMGGMVAKAAIENEQVSRENIEQLIFLGTPHLGAPKFFYVLETGDFISGLHKSLIKDVVENSPAGYQLLPSHEYFSTAPELKGLYDSYVKRIISTFISTFSLGKKLNEQEITQHIVDNHNQGLYSASRSFVSQINNVDFGTIAVTNIVGFGLGTPGVVKKVDFFWETDENLSGDGTVPLRSAERINQTKIEADYYIDQAEHEKLPSHFATEIILRDLLYWHRRTPLVTAPIYTANQLPTDLRQRYKFDFWDRLNKLKFKLIKPAFVAARPMKTKVSGETSVVQQGNSIIEVINSTGEVIRLGMDYSVQREIAGADLQIVTDVNDSLEITVVLPRDANYTVNHTVPEGKALTDIIVSTNVNAEESKRFDYNALNLYEGATTQFTLAPDFPDADISIDRNGDAIPDTLIAPTRVIQELTLNFEIIGWYLFSPPVNLSSAAVATVLENISDGIAYAWNGSSYFQPDTLRMGQGYWLPISTPTNPIFSGTPKDSIRLHLTPGWHLIGPLSKSVDFTNPQDTPDGSIIATFGWDPASGSYYPTTTLEPGKGYWIAVAQECDLTIGGSAPPAAAEAAKAMSWQAFADKFGATPPLPPSSVISDQFAANRPEDYGLSQNYPNPLRAAPFNPETVIEYQLPEASKVSLKIYDLVGREVRTLIDAEKPAGYHRVRWDGKNEHGQILPAGIYFVRMHAAEFTITRKITLLK